MILKNVNHVNIIVKDLNESRKFFEDFLMLEKHSTYKSAYLIGNNGPILVALEFPKMSTPNLHEDKHQCFKSITFEVDSLADLVNHAANCGINTFSFDDDNIDTPVGANSISPLNKVGRVSVRDNDANLWHFTEPGHGDLR
ncbi:VOC family protein [Pseudomonadota bacterium]